MRRPGPPARSRRHLAAGLLAASLLTAAIVVAPANSPRAAAAPGTAGVPQAPLVLFREDFDDVDATPKPIALPDYIGGDPGGPMTYLASASWLSSGDRCNGWVLNRLSPPPPDTSPPAPSVPPPPPPPDHGCYQGTSWNALKDLASELGGFQGEDPSTNTNQVLGEFSSAADPVDRVMFQTAVPIADDVVGGHFFQVAALFVADNCPSGAGPHIALSAIHDQTGSGPLPGLGGGSPVGILDAPDLCLLAPMSPGGYWFVPLTSQVDKSPVTLGTIGLRIENLNPLGAGNDSAVDAIELRDVTPQLDLAFGAATAKAGEAVDLVLTVTNTTDLLAKPGWSFTDTLPAGLTVVAVGTTTCPGGVLTAPPGSATVELSSDLVAGAASCSATVKVTASGPGSFTNGPANLALDGVSAPAAALLTVSGGALPPTGASALPLVALALAAFGMVVGGLGLIRGSRRID